MTIWGGVKVKCWLLAIFTSPIFYFGKCFGGSCPKLRHEIERTWHFIAQNHLCKRRYFYYKICQKSNRISMVTYGHFKHFRNRMISNWDKQINNLFNSVFLLLDREYLTPFLLLIGELSDHRLPKIQKNRQYRVEKLLQDGAPVRWTLIESNLGFESSLSFTFPCAVIYSWRIWIRWSFLRIWRNLRIPSRLLVLLTTLDFVKIRDNKQFVYLTSVLIDCLKTHETCLQDHPMLIE